MSLMNLNQMSPEKRSSSAECRGKFLNDFQSKLSDANPDYWNLFFEAWDPAVIETLKIPFSIKALLREKPSDIHEFSRFCERHIAEIQAVLKEAKPRAAKKLF